MTDQLVQPRARQLSAAPRAEQRDKYLTFSLGRETFAMDIRFIKEIIQHSALTEVPLMPPFIRGVINLRGAVVPVVDLAVRFDRPPTEVGKKTCVVILEVQHGDAAFVLGTLVDNVSEVLEIASGDIEAAPAFGNSLRSEFIRGVGKVGGRFVILLDVGHVLSVDEMAELCANRAG
ncbi:MAG TPA: chemotaxis protein CheW [Holophaga sp.]|nr:chemotaxis protein CheW [Holophaga sp.]